MSRKLLVDDGSRQRELLLVGTMVVGRDPSCEISSGDPRLSRRHAEFLVTPEGVLVRDLQSRNGIRVNGQPVAGEAYLQPGDVVHVAHLALHFVHEAERRPDRHRSASSETRAGGALGRPAADDDRTRAVPPAAFGVASGQAARAPIVQSAVLDDRTRVSPGPPSGMRDAPVRRSISVATAVAPPPPLPRAVPFDAGEIVIRDAPVEAGPATSPPALGVTALVGVEWGRRALSHGVLLAVLVQTVTLVPVLVWQSQAFGASVLSAWHVLLPAFGASVLAGVLVSTAIVRLTARGLGASGASRARRG